MSIAAPPSAVAATTRSRDAGDGVQALDLGFDAALAAGALEHGLELAGEAGGLAGGGCGGQQGAGQRRGEAAGDRLDGGEVAGEVLAQVGAELVAGLAAVPDGVLLGAGKDGDGLGEFAVGRQLPVGVGVGAQDVRQHHRVEVVGLLARDAHPGRPHGRFAKRRAAVSSNAELEFRFIAGPRSKGG